MRRKWLTILVIILGASQLAGGERPVKLGTDDELLSRPVANRGPSAASVDLAFETAMLGSRTPGGAAITEGCPQPSESAVRFRGTTLREVLDDIVTAHPDYVWAVREGVVDLVPAIGVPDLLKLQIPAYDSGDATSLATAGTYLLALPVVRERAEEMGFSLAAFGSGPIAVVPGALPARRLFNVQLRDMTLLEALNALVRANGRGIWIYHQTYCKSEKNFQVQFTN